MLNEQSHLDAEQGAEVKREFSFDDGLRKAIEIIDSLLFSQDIVVVAIAGPFSNDTGVGKTFLTTKLSLAYAEKGINVVSAGDTETLPSRKDVIAVGQKYSTSNKLVIILGAMTAPPRSQGVYQEFRNIQNSKIITAGEKLNLPLCKIDVFVLIYRPDQQLNAAEKGYADIVINNEGAKPKPRMS